MLKPIERMWERIGITGADSDAAMFFDLLYMGELLTKLACLGVLAAVVDERERHHYRLVHQLCHADSLGDWVAALEDCLVGPASQHILIDARAEHRDFTEAWSPKDVAWQRDAVLLLDEASRACDLSIDDLPTKVSLRHWFTRFAPLRNRTRGHGAPRLDRCSVAAPPLAESLRLISESMLLFGRPWAFLYRNLSGKYRVLPLGGDTSCFEYLKREREHSHVDGIHVWFGEPCQVPLVHTDVSLTDFFIANGNYQNAEYEALSYVTDDIQRVDGSRFALAPQDLPGSETDARPELDVVGNSFTDIPPPPPDYVPRPTLEAELLDVLLDDRFPVVTLVGRGGIGKTSTALRVLRQVADQGNYFAILWFSARDIDLLAQGPRLVRPQVLTKDEIAAQLASKLNPAALRTKGFSAVRYFSETISDRSGSAPLLIVFDNFETVRSPSELYNWINTVVRLPNKVLITSRTRDFKADYPIEVGGMTPSEFTQLVRTTAGRLGLESRLSDSYIQQLYEESDGHPYVAKVFLGEASLEKGKPTIKRVLAAKEDVLNALFERSFSLLRPAAQRLFLTLCGWRSHIPRVALEAAILRPGNERIDVEGALDEVERSSLIEVSSPDVGGQTWISVPLAAALFGQRRLVVTPMKSAIEADLEILQSFGAAQGSDMSHGVEPRVQRLVGRIAELIQEGEDVSELMHVLEYVASRYTPAWLDMAKLSDEAGTRRGPLPTARECIQRYLELEPEDVAAWRQLVILSRRDGDALAEVHAWVELASRPEATFRDISTAANRFNSMTSEGRLILDSDEKRVMAEKLRTAMESRIDEANATDCSRVAWLCLYLDRTEDSVRLVERGLAIDPNNDHCLRLKKRLADQHR